MLHYCRFSETKYFALNKQKSDVNMCIMYNESYDRIISALITKNALVRQLLSLKTLDTLIQLQWKFNLYFS